MKAVDQTLAGVRILIAEDDAIQALDVREILRRADAEIVGPVPTLKQALAMIRAFPVSAALLDVNLRDGDVFPAAHALREHGAGIVFYTGYAAVDSLRRDWPDAWVLTKPSPPRRLISAIYAAANLTVDNEITQMRAPMSLNATPLNFPVSDRGADALLQR